MAHVEDRWFKSEGGRRVKTARHGRGLRWRARYVNPDGDERSRSFDRKLDAERFLTAVEASKNTGTYRDPDAGRVTLRKYAAGWAESYPADSTRGEIIRRQLELHILPKLGSRTLADLEQRPSLVQQFLTGLPMGPAGVSQVAITLKAIVSAAIDDRLITSNPFRAQSVRVPKQPRSKVVPWTMEQVEQVRAGLPARYRAAADCGAGLGGRLGEILALGPDEIDFLRRTVHVGRQVKRVNGRLWFALPKGGRERDVPMADWVALRLAAHLEQFGAVDVTLPWNEPGNPRRHGKAATFPLLFTRNGAAVNSSTFNSRAWRPARNAAGIGDGGMHQLRHLFASAMLAGGVDVKALSEYLGHHDPAITLRIYAHLMPSAEGRALRAVEAAFRALSPESDGPGTAQTGGNGR